MRSRKKSSLTKFHYLDYFWERKLVKIVQGQTRWIVHIPSKCTLNSAYLMNQWKFSQHMLTVRSISTRSSPMSQHRSPVLSMRLVFSAINDGPSSMAKNDSSTLIQILIWKIKKSFLFNCNIRKIRWTCLANQNARSSPLRRIIQILIRDQFHHFPICINSK